MIFKFTNMAESSKGFDEGSKISKLSFITFIGLGIIEIIVGYFTNSMVTIADGIDSIGDSIISLIVWLGLVITRRKPDARFRFGYYKVESFAALLAAISMTGIGILITYNAIEHIINPVEIVHNEIALITLAIAAAVSGYRAYQMHIIAKKYNLLSLKAVAKNSIKDSSGSIIGFVSVIIATYTGFLQMDSIGALAISSFIFTVSYFVIKESSLILLDAVKNPEITDELTSFIKTRYKVHISNILLRPIGPYLHGELHILVEKNMTLEEFNDISESIEKEVKRVFPSIKKLIITGDVKY